MNSAWIIGKGPSHVAINTTDDVFCANDKIVDYPNSKFLVTVDYDYWRKWTNKNTFNATTVFVLNRAHSGIIDSKIVRDANFNIEYDLSGFKMIIKSDRMDGISRSLNDFRSNANSGLCAFQLALVLGYKEIHLNGLDFSGGYAYCIPHLSTELGIFKEIYPDVKVINHSPTSLLREYFGYEPFPTNSNSDI